MAAACWPGASAPGLAGEPEGFDSLAIERDLRAIRSRIDQAPRASSFDLDRAARDLWEHRRDAPGDPRVPHLEREIRDLRHDADRQLRAPSRDLRDHSGTRQPRSLSDGACWNPRLGRAPCVFRGLETRPFSLY